MLKQIALFSIIATSLVSCNMDSGHQKQGNESKKDSMDTDKQKIYLMTKSWFTSGSFFGLD